MKKNVDTMTISFLQHPWRGKETCDNTDEVCQGCHARTIRKYTHPPHPRVCQQTHQYPKILFYMKQSLAKHSQNITADTM